MLGNQDILEKSVFPKEFKPCMSLLPKGPGSRTKLQRVRENLCANAASQIGCFVNNAYQNLAKCRTVFSQFWPQLSRFSPVFDP
jgi:hypothetical protein